VTDFRDQMTVVAQAEEGNLTPLESLQGELKELADVSKVVDKALDDLGSEAKQAGDDLEQMGTDAKGAADDTDKLRRSLEDMDRRVGTAASGVKSLKGELSGLRKRLKDASAKAFGESLKAAEQGLIGFKRRIGEIALEKLVEGIKAGAVAVAEFDETMAQVRGLTGATGDTFDRLAESAKNLGATTRFSASEAAAAQRELAKAGFEVSEILEATGSTLTLAQTGFTSMAEAAGIAAVQVRAFGGTAADLPLFVDQLALASSNANTNLGEMAEALSKVAGTATAFNNTMGEAAQSPTELQGEMLTLLQVLADSGKTAEEAGVALRNLFGQLTQLRDGSQTSRKALEELGLTAEDLSPATHGLTGAILNLAEGNRQAGDAFDLVGVKAADALQILAQNTDRITANQEAMEGATGTASRLAAMFDDNLVGAYKAVISAAENLAIVFGESGGTDAVRASMEILATAMRDNEEVAQALGATFGTLGVALNTVATGLVTGFTLALDTIVVAVSGIQAAVGEGIAGIGAVMNLFKEDMGRTFEEFGDGLSEASVDRMEKALKEMEQASRRGGDTLKKIWGEDFPAIFGATGEAVEEVSEEFDEASTVIREAAFRAKAAAGDWEELQKTFEATGEEAEDAGQKLLDLAIAAEDMARGVKQGLEEISDGKELEKFKVESTQALEEMVERFQELGQEIPEGIVDALAEVSSAADELPEKFGASLDAVRDRALDASVKIKAALKQGFETEEAREAFEEGAREMVEGLLAEFERLGEEVPQHLQSLAEELGALPPEMAKVEEAAKKMTEGLPTGDGEAAQGVAEFAETIVTAFDDITKITPAVQERFKKLTDDLIAQAKAAGGTVPPEIFKIRDGLGITAQLAEEAGNRIAGALSGLSEIDVGEFGAAAEIRKFFTELITGSDEMAEAFQNLSDKQRGAFEEMVENLERMASEGSLTQEKLAEVEERIRSMLASAGATGSIKEFNDAMRQAGESAEDLATKTDQASESAQGGSVVWDEATQTYRSVTKAAEEASEALKMEGAKEGQENLTAAGDAAKGAGEAATEAAEALGEAGANAGEAAEGIGEAGEESQKLAEAQKAIGDAATAAVTPVEKLKALIAELSGMDVSKIAVNVAAVGASAEGSVASVKALTGALNEAADAAARLRAELAAAQAEGGATA
jgi:TP901 family phage tail tape measure protein